MAKANPKAWFTSPIAKITYGKVDKWAKYSERLRPFFPTWKEAHAWMLAKAQGRAKAAERELASAKKHLAKIEAMIEPVETGVAPAHPGEQP